MLKNWHHTFEDDNWTNEINVIFDKSHSPSFQQELFPLKNILKLPQESTSP